MDEDVLVYAVGGESHCAPADTIPAYWGAIGAGAEGLLIGVQRTSDGVLVCCGGETLAASTGDSRQVSEVSASDLARMDAGAMFRSTELGPDNQPSGQGADTPWHRPDQVPLYHPRLDEVLLVFGRRAALLLEPIAPGGDAAAVAGAVEETVQRFGLTDTVLIVGDRTVAGGGGAVGRAYRSEPGEDAAQAQRQARELGCPVAIVDAESWSGVTEEEPALIVASRSMAFALAPDACRAIADTPAVAGLAGRAVHETRALLRPPALVVSDDFAGDAIDRSKWVAGYSKVATDTVIRQQDGLHIEIAAGGQYSGAAALTTYSIPGRFDARIDFTVENPHQGTTFELAAIEVDPGYHHMDNRALSNKSVHLTFDVHGAPPYASSERDEDDGFRIGWNNGPAVTQFVDRAAQSSNIYNKYSRDVGDGSADNPSGTLRLVRNGAVFNAYYRDRHNRAWVLCGSANVPTLAEEVFLRIGAKHWPKGGRTPPPNKLHFGNFRLFFL